MEPHKKRLPICFASLHVLHICLSIGLIVAVVHNQLVNNARFETLEHKCDCNHNSDGKSFLHSQATKPHSNLRRDSVAETQTYNAYNYTKDSEPSGQNKSASTADSLQNKTLSNTIDSEEENINSGYSNITEPSERTSASIYSSENKTLPTEDSENLDKETNATRHHETRMNSTFVQNEINQTLKGLQNDRSIKSNRSSIAEPTHSELMDDISKNTTLGILGGKLDLLSCLEELKVIVDDYLESGKPLKRSNGCKLIQGAKGEKGCAGTSFASPSFQPSPQNLVFNERETTVLISYAKSNPSAEITWYRNNVLISEEPDNASYRYSIENHDITPQASFRAISYCPSEIPHPVTQSSLMIKNSSGSDTGSYVCKARNILGSSSYKIHILIRVYVQFTTLPSNTTVVQGENVQLSCRASGVPDPSITWYRKDGGPMPAYYNFSNRDLQIQNITKEEEGTFTCLATNVLGSKTTEATIIVNVFPQITLFLSRSITVNESNTLVLPCSATGFPIPDIQWSKIKNSLPKDRYSYDSRLLNITSVRYEDRGEYVCTANNTVGSTQRKVKVVVQVGPKIIRRPNAAEFGYLSKTKRLLFKVFSFPAANVTWQRPYWDRTNDGRFRQENGSFVIENVQYTDSGLYQVVARNILGEVRLTTFLVVRDVIIPPMLTAKPSKEVLSFSQGASISLNCTAIGAPIPIVTWVNADGVKMASDDITFKGSNTLKLNSFTSQQRGRYTCTAKNDFGKIETHVYLLITSEIRLAGSPSNPYQGRVEIYQSGQWGTVCGKSWGITNANITCKQLGFSTATNAHQYANFGQGSGTVYRLSCNGHESRLQDCSVRRSPTYVSSYRRRYYNYGSSSSSTCGHDRDAGVTCK